MRSTTIKLFKEGKIPINIVASIRGSWKVAFPPRGSFRGTPIPVPFTIRMEDGGYDYIYYDDDLDELFKQTQGFQNEVAQLLQSLPSESDATVDNYLVETMSRMIFGSNAIEEAGAGYDITFRLCQLVFQGQEVKDNIDERDEEYEHFINHLGSQSDIPNTTAVIRSRCEVVQHARALSYIITEMVIKNHDLTEEIIMATHEILTYNVPTSDGVGSDEYSGKYRKDEVCAGFKQFTLASEVPREMSQLIREFNKDMDTAIEEGSLDPYVFAAKYCYKFVNIHPFLDGNGRVCRLILNALLLKTSGIIVVLGEEDSDREEYIIEVNRTSFAEQLERDDDDDDGPPKKRWKGLSVLTLRQAKLRFEQLVAKLKD